MDEETKAFFADLGLHEGYAGMFSRAEAKGAFPNGTRIKKTWCEDGDSTASGTLGTVLGSVRHEGRLLYFVEWDDKPRIAIGTVEDKIGRA